MQNLKRLVLAIAMSLTVIGCSDQAGLDPSTEAGDRGNYAVLQSQLPPLPAAHSASVATGLVALGSEEFDRAAEALEVATSLQLPSTAGALCWGIWGFSGWPLPTECEVDFDGTAGAQAYIAIADYTKGAWEIRGPFSGPQQTLTLNDPKYSNGSGDTYIAVLSFDSASVDVHQIVLIADPDALRQPIDNSGGYTSLAMVNGRPAISYYDDSSHVLRYIRANDRIGATWGTGKTPDNASDTGMYTSLAIVDGFPAIAYYNFTNKRLRYVRALDENGANWGTPVTVDGSPNCGEFCSLKVVNGNPAISYYSSDVPALRYVRAMDTTGASWGLPVSADADGNTGQETCLEMVGGRPAIAYCKGAAGEVRYVRALDDFGASWDTPKILQSGHNSGFTNSLKIVNGRPAVACYDLTDSALLYFRALDDTGETWGSALTLDGEVDDAGTYCSMEVIGGVPCISYHSGLYGELRFVTGLDQNGAAWSAPQLLDESSVIIGKYTSLTSVYGVPAISYWDQTNGKLCYAWGL